MAAEMLKIYALAIRKQRLANPDVSEPALAPAFQALLTALLPTLNAVPALIVSPEYIKPGAGRPDIALILPGQPPRAFIELKAPAKSADPEGWKTPHDKRQYERLRELPRWAASNFIEFHLFDRSEPLGEATIVPAKALDPNLSDAKADALIDAHDAAPFLALLTTLAQAQPPVAANAKELAALLAHSARYVRSSVQERVGELHVSGPADHPLLQVRDTYRDVLYAHPEAGGYASKDFDALFAAAFAQTLAFGMLLVREGSGQPVETNAWEKMPEEHPLMKTALRVLSLAEVADELNIGFDLMRDTVNSFAPAILAVDAAGRDPILYFYEDFLQIFDPAARERYGVYYTPIEVVRYMVGALDRALKDHLGTDGLRDKAVTILDPATGTGTFPLGVAERVRAQVLADSGSEAEAAMALTDLAKRLYGFELLIGPYAVAHYRLHHTLTRPPLDPATGEPKADWQPPQLPRLGIYLADTLSRPGSDAPAGPLGFVAQGIRDERVEANRVKAEQPILAIIGNPPYRRLETGENETLVGRWMDDLWDDLKKPVRDAGWGNQLNTFPELSVAFWRWALWKLFEADNAPKRGVVAFITNRKFLTGKPYAGLRKMMRERFDRIEIVDLRGDVRAGVRGDVAGDTGVFNIQVGTAILIGVATGAKAEGALASVEYNDSWFHDLLARKAKLDWLTAAAELGVLADPVLIDRVALDDLRPAPFSNGEWLSLTEVFEFYKSGMKSGDNTAFISVRSEDLPAAVARRLAGRADPKFDQSKSKHYMFRLLDRRWLYNDLALLQRPGPELQNAWGRSNLGIQALKSSTNEGPGAWCNALLPDYDSFNARGGYAFPLYDRRAGPDAHNLSPILIAYLGEAYGAPVTPEDVFDAILALLSATSYTRRFAEDLEDTFPHIPFPADPAVFARAVAVGREIRAVETFARKAAATAPGFAKLETQTADGDTVQTIRYADGQIILAPDGRGRVSGIPQGVWDFAVSGYRVLPRWLDGRKGQPATYEFFLEMKDVAQRIAELIHRFDEADLVLADTLANSLTRVRLGFPDTAPAEAVAADD